jgi:hypothetical protein
LLFNGIGDLAEDFIEQAHQYGIQDHLRSRNSKLNEKRAFLHVNWEQVHNHPAVQIKLKDENERRMTMVLFKLLKSIKEWRKKFGCKKRRNV